MAKFIKRNSTVSRLRYQVAGVTLCAIFPYFIRHWIALGQYSPKIVLLSVGGSLIASLLGLFFLRNINAYPGVEGSAYIVPSFCLSYALVLILILFLRFEYARSLFALSFILDIIFCYVLYFTMQRRLRMTVGLVPGGNTEELLAVDRIHWVPLDIHTDMRGLSAVAVDLRAPLDDEWDRRLADFALAGLPVYHSKHLQESLMGRVALEHLSENSFGSLSPVSAYMTLKHILDWIAALAALVVLLPFLFLLAAAIMIDSRGSPIFRQPRIGYRGRPFVVWKFRSMKVARAEDVADGRTSAMTGDADARITRIGRVLRKSRLDELPQIVNVLKGEMSWIGPRPEAVVLSQWYEAEIPFYRYRHIVRPGITGWAQVSQGHVAEVEDVRNKLYYDFYYIKNFSPWIDILICARTVRTMLTGFGAR